MATTPRLPAPVEHRLLKWSCELPPRLQRRIFGAPPQIDGQVLTSDTQALLTLARLSGSASYTQGLPPEEARLSNRIGAAVVAARPPIPMAKVTEVEVRGPAGTLPGRHYLPGLLPPGPSPLLLYFHGGGWIVGDLDTHDGVCRFLAAAAGVAVLSVDYRLAPEHPFPAAFEDACAAFEWTHANAAELGADPDRIAVGGDSAGGNLAGAVCIAARDAGGPAPALQLLIYPVTDAGDDWPSRHLFADGFLLTKADMDYFEGLYLPNPGDAADPRVSILRSDDLSNLPPAYLVTAGFDPLRDEGEAYAERLRDAGGTVALRRHPGLIHGFANQTAICRSARAAMRELAGALRMGLGPAGVTAPAGKPAP